MLRNAGGLMKFISTVALFTIVIAGTLVGCSNAKAPDVAGNIRKSLDKAGYKHISVAEDREKTVVVLKGQVSLESEKSQAEELAKSLAGAQVVANEIRVLPPGEGGADKAISSDADQSIRDQVDAMLIQNNLHENVRYSTQDGVVRLTGDVNSQLVRDQVQQMTAAIPNVQRVVNEIQVKTGTN
jgi:osmotically-inducible protein OsmY